MSQRRKSIWAYPWSKVDSSSNQIRGWGIGKAGHVCLMISERFWVQAPVGSLLYFLPCVMCTQSEALMYLKPDPDGQLPYCFRHILHLMSFLYFTINVCSPASDNKEYPRDNGKTTTRSTQAKSSVKLSVFGSGMNHCILPKFGGIHDTANNHG